MPILELAGWSRPWTAIPERDLTRLRYNAHNFLYTQHLPFSGHHRFIGSGRQPPKC
jgi:hypothetical protein